MLGQLWPCAGAVCDGLEDPLGDGDGFAAKALADGAATAPIAANGTASTSNRRFRDISISKVEVSPPGKGLMSTLS